RLPDHIVVGHIPARDAGVLPGPKPYQIGSTTTPGRLGDRSDVRRARTATSAMVKPGLKSDPRRVHQAPSVGERPHRRGGGEQKKMHAASILLPRKRSMEAAFLNSGKTPIVTDGYWRARKDSNLRPPDS